MIKARNSLVDKERIFIVLLVAILLLAGLACIYTIKKDNNVSGPKNPSINQNSAALNSPPDNRAGDLSKSTLSQSKQMPPNNSGDKPGNIHGNILRNGNSNSSGNGNFEVKSIYVFLYALIFLIIAVLSYLVLKCKKTKIMFRHERLIILLLFSIGLLMRIAIGIYYEGFISDINLFKKWAETAVNSFGQFYTTSSSDYPPLYIYVLFLIGKINTFSSLGPFLNLIMKMPSILADIASAMIILKIAKKYTDSNTGILLSMFYLFNPAVFINSSMWGQVDSFFTLLVLIAVYMLTEERIGLASVFFVAAVLMKPQGIIFLPVLFFELVRRKNFKDILKVTILAVITAIIIVLPFSLNLDLSWIYKLFAGTVGEYPYASVNAFNLNSMLGANYVNDANVLFIFSYHIWGLMFICMTTMFSWLVYNKGNSRLFVSAAAMFQIIGVFTLSTRMHERYLFPAIALAILSLIYLRDKRMFLISLGVSTTSFLNTAFILFHLSNLMSSNNYDLFVRAISFINIILVAWSAKILFELTFKKRKDINAITVN